MKVCDILVFNSGSSSLKFGCYRMESSLLDDFIEPALVTETLLNAPVEKETFQLNILLEGELEFSTDKHGQFKVKDAANKQILTDRVFIANHIDAAQHILRYMAKFSMSKPEVIAHRVVHGGPNLLQHCFINDKVMRQLEAAAEYSPLHHQAAFNLIKYTRSTFSFLPQVACFDTTFHADMPEVSKQLPIDKNLRQQGLHRYGFHGLSCESVVFQLAYEQPKKLIVAHLGSGCSITAINNNQSVDTSMGLTPSGGVMMGTRCGDIDPGVLLYLLRHKHYSLEELDKVINHQSGLLGVSGLSSDMRILHEAATTNPDAQLAIEMFCYAVAKQIGAMTAALNGIDTLVFTGGIGEHDAVVRKIVCNQLDYLKIVLDDKNNNSINTDYIHTISGVNAACAVRVVKSQENVQIARHTAILLKLLPN